MVYNFETYYSDKIDFIKAVKIVASYTANLCEFYEAEIIAPKKGYKGTKSRHGQLSVNDKEKFITDIIDWILENSEISELFKLFLYNNPIQNAEPRIFDHHDDTCCWALNLTADQFTELQKELKSNDLPEDLFFDSNKSVCVKSKGIMGLLGFNKCYTPKEYEVSKKQ